MGPWTYYAPFIVGLLLPFGVHQAILDHPTIARLPAWQQWLTLGGFSLLTGLSCQLLMVAAQGAFAHVLPVPRGRSIRGRAAAIAGTLLACCVASLWAAGVLWSEQMGQPALVMGIIGGLAGVIALLIYIWFWPMADRDFAA